MKELAKDYEEKVLPGLATSTIIGRKQKIRDYVIPAIGNLNAKTVTGSDIVEMLERVADKSPKLVKSVLSATRLIFAHGIARHAVTIDKA